MMSDVLNSLTSLLPTLGFLTHVLLELPAALNFFFNPLSQLVSAPATAASAADTSSTPLLSSPPPPTPLSPTAPVVIRQYAVLLFSSILIAGAFVGRPVDSLTKQVASALSLYHFAAALRAFLRVWGGEGFFTSSLGGVGGPGLHLALHALVFVQLLCVWGVRVEGGPARSKTG